MLRADVKHGPGGYTRPEALLAARLPPPPQATTTTFSSSSSSSSSSSACDVPHNSARIVTMALDLLSDNWPTWPPPPPPAATSPRISFSCDLDSPSDDQHHFNPRSDDSLLVDSPSSDFDFCVSCEGPEPGYSSGAADVLFSGGFLLPLAFLQPRESNPTTLPSFDNPNSTTSTLGNVSSAGGEHHEDASFPPQQRVVSKDESTKESAEEPINCGAVSDEKPVGGKQPLSFWRFGRSSSLNCSASSGGGGRRSGLICSLPLLSRSKSAGSNPSMTTTRTQQQCLHSTTAASGSGKLSRKRSSGNGSSGGRSSYYYGQHNSGTGVRISPVLNVPPAYIPRGGRAGIFGIGHLLCRGKGRSRKRAQFPPYP